MIKLLRVDHRLLHGQVAMTWTQELDTNCILIACDAVVKDDVRKTTLKLARPAGVKLVIKSVDDSIEALRSGVTDKYKLFVVCETIQQAGAVAKAMGVKKINLGNVAFSENARQVSTSVFLTPENEAYVKELLGEGYELFIQMIPADAKTDAAKVIG